MLPWAGLPVAYALPEVGDSEVSVAFGAFTAQGDAATGRYRYEAFFKRLDVGAETNDFQDGNHVLTLGPSYRLETAR